MEDLDDPEDGPLIDVFNTITEDLKAGGISPLLNEGSDDDDHLWDESDRKTLQAPVQPSGQQALHIKEITVPNNYQTGLLLLRKINRLDLLEKLISEYKKYIFLYSKTCPQRNRWFQNKSLL
jgi:hypothetical protein